MPVFRADANQCLAFVKHQLQAVFFFPVAVTAHLHVAIARVRPPAEVELVDGDLSPDILRVGLQTRIPNILACGDVAGPYQFTHVAAHQA